MLFLLTIPVIEPTPNGSKPRVVRRRRAARMSAKFIPPPGYGEPNPRPSRSERESAKRTRKSAQERREGNCDLHRAMVKQLPCVVCWKAPPNDGHHLKGGGARLSRGMGMRAVDRFLIPLCRRHHDDLESYGSRREFEWLAAHAVEDPEGLADALYLAPLDVQVRTAIVAAHRGLKVKI